MTTICFVHEDRLELEAKVLSRSEKNNESVKLLLDQAVPCMLHMEMRMGGEIVQRLLSKGIDKCGATKPLSNAF